MDDEELEEYEQEARLQSYGMSLRLRKNARAPILRLPVELVVRIFSLFPASPLLPHTRCTRPPPWLAVTHVCRRWRTIALSCPALWTDIITDDRNWTREMLLRSQSVPINIRLGKPLTAPQVLPVLSHANRARSLELVGGIPLSNLHLLHVPTPYLESLTLHGIMFPRHAKSVSSILPNAPKLRDLSIGKIGVSWPLHLLNPDIVHLTIDEIGIRDRPSLPQLREALQAMPKLETLALTYSLPVQPAHATIYTVSENCDVSLLPTLPSVTSLKLAATSGIDILAFNTNFYFPSVTSLEIASSLDLDPGHTSLQSILASLCSFYQPVLSSQRQGQKPFYFRSLSIEYNEDSDGWDIRAGGPTTNTTNERYPSWMRTQFEPRFTTKLQTSRRADIEGFCKAMCQLLPMEHVSTLVVDCDLFRQRDDWLQAFCRMTNIATLMVRGAAVHGLVDALDDEVGANVRIQTSAYIADVMALVHGELGATVPAHIFPRMEHLAIGRVSFDAVADDPQTLYEHLRSGLERRHQEGTGVQPLARLAVHDCNIQVEHVTQLGEAVTHGALDWDGRWAGLLELLGADFTTTEGSDA